MKTPIISLIIPARGEERLLRETVDHALRTANGFPVEIIIADNGLTIDINADNQSVRIINCAEKKGTGYARHCGIQHSSGSIIVTIDAHVKLDADWAYQCFFALSKDDTKQDDNVIACGHIGYLDENFSSISDPVYHGAELAWTDPRSGDFRPLAAVWYKGNNPEGERGAIMGAYYAFTRKCYEQLFCVWRLSSGWGCDEELLSLTAACMGKSIRMLPLSCKSWHYFPGVKNPAIEYTPQDIGSVIETRLQLASLFPLSRAARNELQALPLRLQQQQEFADVLETKLCRERLDAHLNQWCQGYREFLNRTDMTVEYDEKAFIPSV